MIPLLVRVEDLRTQTVQEYAFQHSPVRIGRNPLNDLALDLPFVSQWHSVVQFDQHQTVYYDLGATNATSVNGQRLQKNQPIAATPETEFRITSLRIQFARGIPHAGMQVGRAPGGFAGGGFQSSTMVAGAGEGNSSTMVFDPATGMGANQDPSGAMAVMNNIAALRAAVSSVKPHYDAYRTAWTQLWRQLQHVLNSVPQAAHPMALVMLQQELPALAGEDQFQKLAASLRVDLAGDLGMAATAGRLVGELARYLLPQEKQPRTGADIERFLGRIVMVLEAYSASFVALRKGHDQFGTDLALPHHRAGEPTPLNAGSDPRELLAYMLDWGVDGPVRVQELTAAFADIMIHEVALLNGLMEGVRGLLQRLGPIELEKEASKMSVKIGFMKFPGGMWPFRSIAKWQRYADRHRELTEEDSGLTAAVFGREFAKAYAGVVGENFTEGGPRRLNVGTRG